jgi:hypothetical protein
VNNKQISDVELQNAIWFGTDLVIFDANGNLIEKDKPVSYDENVVKCMNGMYLREVCSFELKK